MPRLRTLAVLLAVALLAAGCGSSGNGSAGSASSSNTSAWVSGVCSSINTWTSSVATAAGTIKQNGPSKASLQSAADDTKAATTKLESDLKGLGEPDTQSGTQAKAAADQLATNLTTDTETIKTAIDGASGVAGVLTAAATVSTTLVAMGAQVSSTVTSLKQLDPGGELGKAFDQSSSCQQLATALPSVSAT